MTPAAHRKEAERLLEEAKRFPRHSDSRANLLAEANAHATLSLHSSTTRKPAKKEDAS